MSNNGVGIRVRDCFRSIDVAKETLTSYYFYFFRKPVGWLVEDLNHKTITAQFEMGLGLSLAIQAKKFYVTGEMPEDIHLMDFNRGITYDEHFHRKIS